MLKFVFTTTATSDADDDGCYCCYTFYESHVSWGVITLLPLISCVDIFTVAWVTAYTGPALSTFGCVTFCDEACNVGDGIIPLNVTFMLPESKLASIYC